MKLNSIVEKEDGWIQLLKAFVFVIPEEEALGPAVMSLFLDDSPLPNKETMNKCTSIRDDLKGFFVIKIIFNFKENVGL